MRSRTFLHVSLAILALAAAFHLGASTAKAQAPVNAIVGFSYTGAGNMFILTSNGDLYGAYDANVRSGIPAGRLGNIWGGGAPTPVQHESLGALKVRYR